jgi:hypothetical protein
VNLLIGIAVLALQRLILQAKAQRIANGPQQNIGDPGTRAPSW